MVIEFTVNSIPVAQPRQRHSVMNFGGKSVVRNYTPKNDPVNAFKAAVQLAASQAYQGKPLDEPLQMSVVMVFPRNKGLMWKTKPMPRLPKDTKPDWDNLGKSLCDALNGLLYRDDSLIYDAHIVKIIAAGDEQPHVRVRIRRWNSEVASLLH